MTTGAYNVHTGRLVQVIDQWLANAHTPLDVADRVRALIVVDAAHDLSGTYPHLGMNGEPAGGRLTFTQRTAIVVSRQRT